MGSSLTFTAYFVAATAQALKAYPTVNASWSDDGLLLPLDAIAIRPMAYLSFTFDHRILDGAIADFFLGKVVEYLQNWG